MSVGSSIRRVICMLLCLPNLSFAAWPSDPNANLLICGAQENQYAPRIASDGSGGAYVAWFDYRDPGTPYDRGIYAQHVLAGGIVDPAWPADGLWLGPGTAADIAADGTGGAFVVWSSTPQLNDGRARVQRIEPRGISPGWPSGGALLTPFALTGGVDNPRIAPDGVGGAFITWEEYGFITFQHVGPNGEIAILPALTSTVQGGWGGLTWDGAGGALAGWGGADAVMRVQHFSWTYDPLDPYAPGLSMWTSSGVPVGSGTPGPYETALAGDGSGGGFVSFYRYDGMGTDEVTVTHLLASGTIDPAWPSGGRVVASGQGPRSWRPEVVADGMGGVIVAWLDNSEVRAGHVLADGTLDPAWPLGGRSMGSAPVPSEAWPGPRLSSDGAGGAVIVWSGFGWNEIYAQRVLAGGSLDPAWSPVTGTVVSLGPNKYIPMSVADGAGGVIVTWYEARAGGNGIDIYAQRVRSDGQLGDGVSGVTEASSLGFVLEPLRPNPARGHSVRVDFSLPGDASASVDLFDVAGRRVVSHDAGLLGAGHHSIDVPIGKCCRSGVYFVRLTQGALTRTTQVVFLE